MGVEAVAERMRDHLVGHYATVPGFGKTSQTLAASRSLEHRLHPSIMTILHPSGKKAGVPPPSQLYVESQLADQPGELIVLGLLLRPERFHFLAQLLELCFLIVQLSGITLQQLLLLARAF